MEDTDSYEAKADWTLLFHHEDAPENSSPSSDLLPANDHALSYEVPPDDSHPSVLVHHRQNNNEPYPVITIRSRRVVKPVQRYGHHSEGGGV